MPYDRPAVAAYFDQFGEGEWQRFDKHALGAIHEHIHNVYLERFVPPGSRVLDICDLSALPASSFEVVVAYGGPLSYVFDRRDDAVESCRRVLKSGGVFLASVMSLWGTLHRHLAALKELPLWSMKNIVATGDLTPENDPTSLHKCHLFRSTELTSLVERHGFTVAALGASNALSTNLEPLLLELRERPDRWQALLDLEAQATAQPGYVDGGTHLIIAARSALAR